MHRYLTRSRYGSIGGHDAASCSLDDMYHEVDIPSLVDVSLESSIDRLRAIKTCLSTDLLLVYRAI